VNAGDVIHASVPDLTEERRNEYAKMAKEKAEEAKVSIRNARQQVWDETKKAKTDGGISEDEMYRREKEINQFVEDKNKEIDSIYSEKEEELKQV
jgi:ribosome recycling factor